MRSGDAAAQDELLRRIGDRLERLARKMIKGFPQVRRWTETLDVVQNATLRLLRALEQVRPDSTRAFFGLAAEQIRRELLDLARHFRGPHGVGANHASQVLLAEGNAVPEPVAPADPPDELDRWCAFHEAVEKLPVDEREVLGLVFYHGWTQAQVAELFQVSERTVRRWWESAMVRLHDSLRAAGFAPGKE
jgi:RNA polymerase sigma-70 factor (ECF subfamily)